jgi:hypothetical protein
LTRRALGRAGITARVAVLAVAGYRLRFAVFLTQDHEDFFRL